MLVSEILRRKGSDVFSVQPATTIREAGQMMAGEGIGSVLVLSGPRIAGIVSERDIVRVVTAEGGGALDRPVDSIMTEAVITCRPQEAIKSVMETMTARRIRHLPVVDDDGYLCGLVSIGDVVKQRLQEAQAEMAEMEAYVRGGVG